MSSWWIDQLTGDGVLSQVLDQVVTSVVADVHLYFLGTVVTVPGGDGASRKMENCDLIELPSKY